nr:MAG TPA: hypothetical protein [Caudoviricetes sp.]
MMLAHYMVFFRPPQDGLREVIGVSCTGATMPERQREY